MTREQKYRQAMAWLASDDTGISSEALLSAAMGTPNKDIERGYCWPHDPADIGRCFRLIDKMPWVKSGLKVLARKFPMWARLVAHWDEIRMQMDAEVGVDWSKGERAEKTYNLMQLVMGED